MKKTVRFHTGSRVVRLRYDPDAPLDVADVADVSDPASVDAPEEKPAKPRGWFASVLVIAAGGFIALQTTRWLKRRKDAAEA